MSTMTSATSARTLRTAIKIILQDDGRRGGVEPRLSRSPVLVLDCETAFGFDAGEPLVLQRNGERRLDAKSPRELFHARRHLGRRAIEAAWQSDDDRADAVFFRRE